MIEVRKLTKWYGPFLALDAIDLAVDRGRIVGFLGPNGAGKTTTIRILTCFMPATSGDASINGLDVFKQSADVRRAIGYLPEATPLYQEMRVREHLHLFGKLQGMDRAARRQRIDQLAQRCGLTKIIDRPVGQLSKGNKQRVGLAQALLHDPKVLILDEPTAGLDPAQIRDVRELIRSLAEDKTILLSTHILPEAEMTCDALAIIANGRMVATGTPDELKQQARSRSRIVLEIKANPPAVQQALAAVAGVGSVETDADAGWCVAKVASTDHRDLREALGKAVAENQWPIREMRHEVASLEEFFVQAVAPGAAQRTA